jgi:hypothetical protein
MAKKKPIKKKASIIATYGSPTRRITTTKRKRSSSSEEDDDDDYDDNVKKVAPNVASASASACTSTTNAASASAKPKKRRKIEQTACYDYHDKDASCNLLIEKVGVERAPPAITTPATTDSATTAVAATAASNDSTTSSKQQKTKAKTKKKKKKTTSKRGAGGSVTAEKVPFEYSKKSINNNIINNIGKMNSTERRMWSSSFGATYAAKGCVPSNVCRKLGMITRTILLPPKTVAIKKTKSSPSSFLSKTMEPKKSDPSGTSNKTTKPPTLAQARKEARKVYLNNDNDDEEEEEDEAINIIESMAKQIINDWKIALLNKDTIIPNWNSNGEIVATNNTNTYSIGTIRRMIQSKKWIPALDADANVKNLYHLRIPIDTLTVLKALEQMAKPDPKFYGVPFIIAIPVMEPIKCIDNKNNFGDKCAWRLSISIFAHRLLFECMTAENLRTVMAALDDDDNNNKEQADNTSTVIVRPLVKSPAIGPIIFGKDPKIRVEVIDDDDNVVEMEMEDEKETRTDDTLDAFSTEGFLKLIENQGVSGVDTIYTNKIEPILYGPAGQQQEQEEQEQKQRSRGRRRSRSSSSDDKSNKNCRLQVSLLPHQIHGVCWMYQMENLDNDDVTNNSSNSNTSLGLNGLLWERRAFREGDTYYYSPALGQARLTIGQQDLQQGKRCNKGGILADEVCIVFFR